MKKLVVLIFLPLIFFSCSKDEPEVDPALKYMPIQLSSFNRDFEPKLSPNLKNVVFLSNRLTYNPYVAAPNFELWVMDRYGENARRLIKREDMPEGFEISYFWWSASSDYVTVLLSGPLANNRKSELLKVTLTGEKTILRSFDFSMEQLSFSHDGKKAAFIVQEPVAPNGSPSYRLYSAKSDFTDTLLLDKGLIAGYDWAKDSKTLVYSLYDRPNKNYDLWKIKTDATGKTRFTETAESEWFLRCSKTENQIVFSSSNNIYISGTDKFAPRLVLEDASFPQWIPNKKLIIFLSEQSDGEKFWTESWIADLNGNIIRKIGENGPTTLSFTATGDYYVYSASGNIWMDYLPK